MKSGIRSALTMPHAFLLTLLVILCSMEVVESSEIGSGSLDDGIMADQEIYSLCSLNPFLNICYGISVDSENH
ncbi:unnamed protein product [Gongylonema pulchrum]|uniref:Secreted protein n=1 Tax=Gongylonema pulchrum TaxID=637853 RepID=A0A183EI54_9BILA|nr:unnamed protein product [Gongylonema pulchrum]